MTQKVMLKAVQLDLFPGQPFAPSFESARDYEEPARRAGLVPRDFNPCPRCELREFCGHDDCAQKLYDIDVNFNPGDYEEDAIDF